MVVYQKRRQDKQTRLIWNVKSPVKKGDVLPRLLLFRHDNLRAISLSAAVIYQVGDV